MFSKLPKIILLIPILLVVLVLILSLPKKKSSPANKIPKATPTPLFAKNTPTPLPNNSSPFTPEIQVLYPGDGTKIDTILSIKGYAKLANHQLSYRLKDGNGQILSQGTFNIPGPQTPDFAPFIVTAAYSAPRQRTGILELFSYAPDRITESAWQQIRIEFPSLNLKPVTLFFGNINQGTLNDCRQVFPLPRVYSSKDTPAQNVTVLINEMLKGVTTLESSQGYFSAAAAEAKLNRAVISSGRIHLDFNSALLSGLTTDCRISTLKSQLRSLIQKTVGISKISVTVDGQPSDLLSEL